MSLTNNYYKKNLNFINHSLIFIKFIFIKILLIFSGINCYATELNINDHILFYNVYLDTSSNQYSIIIKWTSTQDTKNIRIAKKLKTDSEFGNYVAYIPSSTINEWKDTNVISGLEYEYSIEQYKDQSSAYAFFVAGKNIPLIEYRGRLLLLIDSTIYDSLINEIDILTQDMRGDGWTVKIRLVPRAEEFDKEKVDIVKNIILEELDHPDSIRTIFLLGRVPVPYSGNYATDGHIPEHCGAWPCDGYYQSFSKENKYTNPPKWIDSIVNNKTAVSKRHWNVINDGKFDNDLFPCNLSIECGRVDMFDLPEFEKSEIELLRQYLNYNHLYRNNLLNYPKNAIINDYFKMYSKYEVFATNGWMNFISLVGSENIDTLDFKTTLLTNKYLLSYGCGPGTYNSCYNIVSSEELSKKGGYNTIFSFLFGSWFGDWDVTNNLMRSMIAATPPALTCAWSARPYWYIHQITFNETIGYSALLTQNNSSFGTYISNSQRGHRGIHISLIGDPTLRLNNILPIENISYELIINNIDIPPSLKLKWNYNDENIEGFNVYRAKNINDKFIKINSNIVRENEFIDNNILTDSAIYQVRVIKKESNRNGTYFNQSIGKFITVKTIPSAKPLNKFLNAYIAPNPSQDYINLVVSGEKNQMLKITINDLLGKNHKTIYNDILEENNSIIRFNINSIYDINNISASNSLYYINLFQNNNKISIPFIIVK